MKAGRVLWYLVQYAGLSYTTLALFGCVAAEKIIFQPRPPSYSGKLPGLRIMKAVDGTPLAVLHLPNPTARHTILYFQRNAEDIGDIEPLLRRLHSAGFAVLAFDYRGYGQSGGSASEQNVYADTRAVLAYARAELGTAPGQCIVWGRSLGSGPAVDLAVHEPVAGLVLVSPIKSTFRVITRVKLLPFDRFDNLAKIGRVHCPILVFHGTADPLIAFEHGKTVFAAAPEPKRAVWIEGARHNDMFEIAGERIVDELIAFGKTLPLLAGDPSR